MSRDFRPKDFKIWHDQFDIPSVYDNLVNSATGEYVYSKEIREYSYKFPMLSLCGPDVFCNLVEAHLITNKLIQQVEDILNDKECDDEELIKITKQWYEGELVPGYYMDANSEEFFDYLKQRIKAGTF